MESDGPRIQRRVQVRKRSLSSGNSLLTPAKKRPSSSREDVAITSHCHTVAYCHEEEENMYSINQDCGSDDDMFGEYDSFAEDPSLLAQVEDLEEKCKQETARTFPCPSAEIEPDTIGHTSTLNAKLKLPSEQPLPQQIKQTMLLPKLKDESEELAEDFLDDLPCSQLLHYENAYQNVDAERSTMKQSIYNCDLYIDSLDHLNKGDDADTKKASILPQKDQKIKSLKDSLKNTLTGNAKVQTPQVLRTKQIKETILLEELDVAKKTVEMSSSIDLGPFYGLPSKVADLIEELRGIKKLYDWQHTCLTLDSLKQRKNLIYSLPTSGGKTLVAEIVMLQELLCRKKDVLMILPYVAIVQEKVRGLSSFGVELDFLIEEYAGSKGRFPPMKRRKKKSLYIATIEKGHSLVNSLIETGRISDLGLVVVDELHMLGEGSRGAILEMTLAKILYSSENSQVIGMSATLNNVDELQQFLKAEYYTDNFRPVELKEYVKLKDCIYEVDSKAENNLTLSRPLNYKYSSNMLRLDPDHIIALVTEVIPNNSCLVFCPTKKNCENVAEMICKYLNKTYLDYRTPEKKILLENLKNTGNGTLCSVLKRTVPFGIAYHHSGLTSDERKLVEEAYSAGVLCLLTCTSTLAAGVNLPARRAQYKQMIGRAGRAGIDNAGESILIIQDKDKQMPSPKEFQRIWQYIQPASQLQTTCNHTSPGPPHPASSPPRSSETSHRTAAAKIGLHNQRISAQTVRNHLREAYLRARRPHRGLDLTAVRRCNRLEWANAHIQWRLVLWRVVLFTDESRFSLSRADGRQRVQELVSKPLEKCSSNLMHDDGKGFQSLLLSLIGLKVIFIYFFFFT
ncbi:hypothetical protein AB205_0030250 [Aquarana catesbeiana]|uniref:Helicase ATP-binding domain-containing protein n=1 Tax=Aquarana catesbeiana TaxID=8400 RepID=A0A2G9P088_AQUCT|nr:hypothetical protein AB205_0030250 [Aquarana catesbeiana]